jgi:hypothetical protein
MILLTRTMSDSGGLGFVPGSVNRVVYCECQGPPGSPRKALSRIVDDFRSVRCTYGTLRGASNATDSVDVASLISPPYSASGGLRHLQKFPRPWAIRRIVRER